MREGILQGHAARLRDQGLSYRAILAELKRRRRFSRTGRPFSLGQVQRMLNR